MSAPTVASVLQLAAEVVDAESALESRKRQRAKLEARVGELRVRLYRALDPFLSLPFAPDGFDDGWIRRGAQCPNVLWWGPGQLTAHYAATLPLSRYLARSRDYLSEIKNTLTKQTEEQHTEIRELESEIAEIEAQPSWLLKPDTKPENETDAGARFALLEVAQ